MIKYLIIDDEYIAHDIIQGYCDMLPNMQCMKNCHDGLEAFEYLHKNQVDLIFLDLNMPKLKGFDFLRTLKNPPKVIVTTAYQEFAMEGYELNISDYLLKPFGFERFLKAINKTFSVPSINQSVSSPSQGISKRIFLRSNKKYTQVNIDSILFIEASGNYTQVTTPLETISIREKISTVLELLPTADFLQVHKSFAVAPKHIKSIEGNRIFIADTIIPIGKLFKVNVNQILK
ncbi:MAG: DNA-binding LytR/AlgR family response regulator [Salibacteraceae bacterium]|jgi:DNA-binding LytR/AlgR family response regulator